ncbi:YtxH domain-containing protein [Gallicola sp. Sow4_E12]|uniref:YtxH domain-containing protein n=1 Tax=Gallicola sp. Sow4_E12 TaxID=3438785 RepID=UPI003F917931
MSIQDYLLEKKREQERKIRWEIAKKKTEGTRKVALGAILGTAAGMIAGVLLAPKSGEETRKDIRNAAEDATKNMKANVNDTIDTIKYKTDELGYDIKDKYHNFQDRNMTRIKKLGDNDDEDYDVEEEEITYNEDGTICLDGNRAQSYVPDESFETVGDSAACLDEVEAKAKANIKSVEKDVLKEQKKDLITIHEDDGVCLDGNKPQSYVPDETFEAKGDSAACLDDVEKKAQENMKKVGAEPNKNVNTPGSNNKDKDNDKIYKAHGEPPLTEASSTDTVDESFEAKGDSAACLDDVEKKAKENMKAVEKETKKNKK